MTLLQFVFLLLDLFTLWQWSWLPDLLLRMSLFFFHIYNLNNVFSYQKWKICLENRKRLRCKTWDHCDATVCWSSLLNFLYITHTFLFLLPPLKFLFRVLSSGCSEFNNSCNHPPESRTTKCFSHVQLQHALICSPRRVCQGSFAALNAVAFFTIYLRMRGCPLPREF